MNEGKATIRISISKRTGQVESKVEGIVGSRCATLVEPLKGLGTVLRDEHDPEFYQQVEEVTSQTLGE